MPSNKKPLGISRLAIVNKAFSPLSSDPRNSVSPRTRLPHQIGRTTLEAIYTQPNQIDYLPLRAI